MTETFNPLKKERKRLSRKVRIIIRILIILGGLVWQGISYIINNPVRMGGTRINLKAGEIQQINPEVDKYLDDDDRKMIFDLKDQLK